jgi:hypothetical protein
MILLPGTYLLIEPPVHYVVQPRSTLCGCVRGSFRGRHRRSLRKQENRAPRQEKPDNSRSSSDEQAYALFPGMCSAKETI